MSRPLYFEYLDKERDVKRIIRDGVGGLGKEKYEVLMIILALAIFNKQVISPLMSAASFANYLQDRNINAIKIRDYVLDSKENKKIINAVYHFGHLLEKFKLNSDNLDLANLRQFTKANIDWMSK